MTTNLFKAYLYKNSFEESATLLALFKACDSSKEAAQQEFRQLSRECRNKIFEQVYIAAGKPVTTDTRWGERNALEDLPRLQKVLHRFACKIFRSLAPDQQNLAEGFAYEHAGKPATDDPEWGKHHIADQGSWLLHSLADVQLSEHMSCCFEKILDPSLRRQAQERMSGWAKELFAQNPGLAGQIKTIASRISAFLVDPKAAKLTLDHLSLPSLPPIFDLKPLTTRLIKLSVCDNLLTELPAAIGNLTALQELDLSGNSLTDVPAWIKNLVNLRVLNLSGNSLTDVPTWIKNLVNLRALNLSDNSLTNLPAQIKNLTVLQYLYLSKNQLTALPIENLVNLCVLDLSETQLTDVPTWIEKLIELRSLNLSGNSLTNLPEQIGSLVNLCELNLHDNSLTNLPAWIGNLTALQYLNLSNNPLTALPTELLDLSGECSVVLAGHSLSMRVLDRLHAATQRAGYSGPQILFSMDGGVQRVIRSAEESLKALCDWAVVSERKFPALSGVNDASLKTWLSRLSDVHDCGNQELRRECAGKVLEYLQRAQDDPLFRETFFAFIDEAATSCGDRMALSIAALGMQYRLATANVYDGKALAHLLRGVWCLNALQEIARIKVGTMPLVDEIEVYLIYPVALREALDLPIDVQGMSFARCAYVTPQEIESAELKVRAKLEDKDALCDFLATQPEWLKALALYHPAEYDACLKEGDVERLRALTRAFMEGVAHPKE
jgi:hypothetical protein